MKKSDKKIKRKIGVLGVLGILILVMLLPSIIAAPVWQDVPYTDSPRIIIDSDGDQPDQVFAITHNVNKAELFRVQETGEVGIGDTSPDFKLEVTGSSGDGYFGVSSTDDEGDNGDIFIIDSNGDVGIGDSTPSHKLEIVDTDATSGRNGLKITQSGAQAGTGYGIKVMKTGDSNTNLAGHFYASGADTNYGSYSVTESSTGSPTTNIAGYFSATSATNNYGLLVANGDVGIGTTSPDAKFDVEVSSGGAAEIGASSNSATGDYAVALGLETRALGPASIAMGSGTIASGDFSTAMGYATTASGDFSTAIGMGIVVEGEISVGIGLGGSHPVLSQDNTMAIMGGNVGIGTVSPDNLLDIEKAGTVQSNLDIFHITNSGNALTMDGTETSILFNQYYFDLITPNVADSGRITVGTETSWTGTANTQDSYMAFHTVIDGGITEKVRITSDGNLGIGITSPTAKTHIVQTAAVDAFRVDDVASDTTPFVINQNGRVGIGTTSPAATLDVRGNALFNADSGNNDFRIKGDSDTNLFFVDASSDRIGIGVWDPVDKLEINGNLAFNTDSSIYARTTPISRNGFDLRIRAGHGYDDFHGIGSKKGGNLYLSGGDADGACGGGTGGYVYIYGGARSDAGDGNVILAYTGSEDRGKVGIGTIPFAKLHVMATSDQLHLGYDYSNRASFNVDSNGALTIQTLGAGTLEDIEISTAGFDNAIYIDDSANSVGIGTTSPNEQLEVSGKIRTNTRFNVGGTDGDDESFSIFDINGEHAFTFTGGILTDYTFTPE